MVIPSIIVGINDGRDVNWGKKGYFKNFTRRV